MRGEAGYPRSRRCGTSPPSCPRPHEHPRSGRPPAPMRSPRRVRSKLSAILCKACGCWSKAERHTRPRRKTSRNATTVLSGASVLCDTYVCRKARELATSPPSPLPSSAAEAAGARTPAHKHDQTETPSHGTRIERVFRPRQRNTTANDSGSYAVTCSSNLRSAASRAGASSFAQRLVQHEDHQHWQHEQDFGQQHWQQAAANCDAAAAGCCCCCCCCC